MTATAHPTSRAARANRRLRLIRLIHSASLELATLEAADRAPTLTIVEPTGSQLAPYNTLASRAQRIRAWGNDHGHPTSGAGRLPKALLDAYEAAHPHETTP